MKIKNIQLSIVLSIAAAIFLSTSYGMKKIGPALKEVNESGVQKQNNTLETEELKAIMRYAASLGMNTPMNEGLEPELGTGMKKNNDTLDEKINIFKESKNPLLSIEQQLKSIELDLKLVIIQIDLELRQKNNKSKLNNSKHDIENILKGLEGDARSAMFLEALLKITNEKLKELSVGDSNFIHQSSQGEVYNTESQKINEDLEVKREHIDSLLTIKRDLHRIGNLLSQTIEFEDKKPDLISSMDYKGSGAFLIEEPTTSLEVKFQVQDLNIDELPDENQDSYNNKNT